MEKVAFCSDHAGYEMKLQMMEYMKSKGYDVHDFGTYSAESCDYPDYAHPAALAVERGECAFGIAELARRHNAANFVDLPARFVTEDQAKAIIDAYLNAQFEGGRHLRRIEKIPVSVM